MRTRPLSSKAEWTLTTSVQLVDADDVVATHPCGLAKDPVGIALGDDGLLAISGEGGA